MKTRAFVLRMIKITVRFSHIILRKVRGKLGKRSFLSQFTDPKKKAYIKMYTCIHISVHRITSVHIPVTGVQ